MVMIENGSPEEIAVVEMKLQLQGYRPTQKRDQTELAPFEYFIRSYNGSAHSPYGPPQQTIVYLR
jgi:hypothetical protein